MSRFEGHKVELKKYVDLQTKNVKQNEDDLDFYHYYIYSFGTISNLLKVIVIL